MAFTDCDMGVVGVPAIDAHAADFAGLRHLDAADAGDRWILASAP
jgi:hypothetical protein